MFPVCSELTPRARIPDTRIPQLMQPWLGLDCLAIDLALNSQGRCVFDNILIST